MTLHFNDDLFYLKSTYDFFSVVKYVEKKTRQNPEFRILSNGLPHIWNVVGKVRTHWSSARGPIMAVPMTLVSRPLKWGGISWNKGSIQSNNENLKISVKSIDPLPPYLHQFPITNADRFDVATPVDVVEKQVPRGGGSGIEKGGPLVHSIKVGR